MKEKNGFMMAELIIVSAIVLVSLSGFYISFNKIFSRYNSKLDYYDSASIYYLAYYRDIMIGNDRFNDILADLSITSPIMKLYDSDDEGTGEENAFKLQGDDIDTDHTHVVYIAKNNNKQVIKNLLSNEEVKETYKDFVNNLSETVTLDSNYVMLIERCISTDECKYGYLEIYDGYEENNE